jgi:cytidine deaminase
VLAEFAADDAVIVLAGPRGPATATHTLGQLLPRAFRLS